MARSTNEAGINRRILVPEGLHQVIQAAHLTPGAYTSAKLWCMLYGISGLHEIADRLGELSTALNLKVLEERRLKKTLATAMGQYHISEAKTNTPHSVEVRNASAKVLHPGMNKKVIKHIGGMNGGMRRWRFVSKLEPIPEACEDAHSICHY